jgi:hypothetical protein
MVLQNYLLGTISLGMGRKKNLAQPVTTPSHFSKYFFSTWFLIIPLPPEPFSDASVIFLEISMISSKPAD